MGRCHTLARATGQGHRTVPPQLPSPVGCSYYKVTSAIPSQLSSFVTLTWSKCWSPPQKASNLCSFYKSLHLFRNHTAAPCSPLRDPGPWPRFSPSFFYNSVLISPWLEEATHLLKAFSELRMKSETEAPSAAP